MSEKLKEALCTAGHLTAAALLRAVIIVRHEFLITLASDCVTLHYVSTHLQSSESHGDTGLNIHVQSTQNKYFRRIKEKKYVRTSIKYFMFRYNI